MRLYRWLLRLYPASFRREYGEEMLALFERRLALAPPRFASAGRVWLAIADVVPNALSARWEIARGWLGQIGPNLTQDTRYAVRSLLRRPTFACIAIGAITAGVGASTSIYGIVNGVLLRPLPFSDAGRLVQVNQIFYKWRGDPVLNFMWDRIPFGVDEYELLRDRATAFARVGLWGNTSGVLNVAGRSERVHATLASATLLDLLDIRPIRGQGFHSGDDRFGGPNVALVGYDAWQRRFGGSDRVIGQSILFDDVSYRIVGVLPPGFKLEMRGAPVAFMLPVGHDSTARRHGNRDYSVVARVKPGVSLAAAELETRRLLEDSTAYQGKKGARLADWHAEQTRGARVGLFVLLAASGLLLGIACINVAILLLGEAALREPEIAARMALGAGRPRIIQQLLTESLLLSIVGSGGGAMAAFYGTKVFVGIAPSTIPGLDRVHVDLRVLAFAIAVSVVTGVLFGLTPAWLLSRLHSSSLVRVGTGHSAGGHGRLQFFLVASQLGLSAVLLVGTGLLAKSLFRLTAADPGFRVDHLLVVGFSTTPSLSNSDAALEAFFTEAATRVASVPGVVEASAASASPFDGRSSSTDFDLLSSASVATRSPQVQQRAVAPNYFRLMGVPVVEGREFNADDRAGAEPVLIVSEATAHRDFPDGRAVGAHVKFQGQIRTIVGIARDVRFRGLTAAPEPTVYAPAAQRTQLMKLLIRTSGPPAALAPTLRKVIDALDAGATVSDVAVMDDLIRASFAEERFRTTLVSAFGILATLLAAIGMYGVTARAVARRTGEIGIRVALGAAPSRVVGLMIRSTLSAVAVGIAAGVVVALIGSHWASTFLFDVGPRDPLAYGGSVAFLAAIALIATLFPARGATRISPSIALKNE
jgi:putative ABC transport system permease protein